jgi:hypothetical protein
VVHRKKVTTVRQNKSDGLTVVKIQVDEHEPVGTCFLATNDMTQFTEYSPCRSNCEFYLLLIHITSLASHLNSKMPFIPTPLLIASIM